MSFDCKLMETSANNGLIEIPLGATISIVYDSKTGARRTANIVNGPNKHQYIAIFDEDDVDFIVGVNNMNDNRDFNFHINMFGEWMPFVVGHRENCGLRTPGLLDRQLHFCSVRDERAQAWIGSVKNMYQISYSEAINVVDHFQFSVRYSKPKSMDAIDGHGNLLISILGMDAFSAKYMKSISIPADATIADIRHEIMAKYHQTEAIFFRLYNGDGETLLANDRTLTSYQLEDHDFIFVQYEATVPAQPFQIKCKRWCGEPFDVSVTSDTTIGQLIQKINDEYGPHMISLPSLRLFWDNRELFEHFTLEDYGLHAASDAILQIRFPTFQVFVKTLTGESISIQCTSRDTIKMVKERIAIKERISIDDQRLVFAGQQLLDKAHLFYYHIGPDSTIHLVVRIRGGDMSALMGQTTKSTEPETGVVCLHKRVHQTFQYCRFVADTTIYIEPFQIEFQLQTNNE